MRGDRAAGGAGGASGRRGQLRLYLGAAPGVGKTFAMLNEGRRRRDRGTDVVVGFVETHGRPRTLEQVGDLEVVPRATIEYRGSTFEEMDLDAVLARRPQVALVDELAHTNVPGSRNEKRWQDVHELLDAGIDVISTLNIQHLESINDVVERITGVVQRETIPDGVAREADQVELVDMTPEALRRRMAHGNVYAPEKIDAALANYFRAGNLGALRELALLWVADQVDLGLEQYRAIHGIEQPWETRERVVVALTGAPSTEALIRRGARMAQRSHGDLLGVHVRTDEGLVGGASAELLGRHRALLAEVGGEYHEVVGADAATALVAFARAENATQLVLGSSRRSRWNELVRGSVINKVIRLSGPIDVHVISQVAPDGAAPRRGPRVPGMRLMPLGARRLAIAWGLVLLGLPLLTVLLTSARETFGLPSVLLLYLLLSVAAAALGGAVPGVAAAIGGFLLANWYFTEPRYELTIAERENLLALLVFLVVAAVVSGLVELAARRSHEAARARAEAETVTRLAVSTGTDRLDLLLSHIVETLGLDGAALFVRRGGTWRPEAVVGVPPLSRLEDADAVEAIGDDLRLALVGGPLAADDRRVLKTLGAQLGTIAERARLRDEVARASATDQANELRTALLQAVSHDLRTPLASIKASVSSLRDPEVRWTREQEGEFLATIEDETDRLTALVGNLLDMSRLQAGVLRPLARPVGLEEVVGPALAGLGPRASAVVVDVPEGLPAVAADPVLLERVVANLVENALHWSPPDRTVRVEAGAVAGRVDLRIVDCGPGIPRDARDQVRQPFQRLGDTRAGTGVGLGLAVASGFVDAMGGELELDDTPGGGTTAVVSLPVAP